MQHTKCPGCGCSALPHWTECPNCYEQLKPAMTPTMVLHTIKSEPGNPITRERFIDACLQCGVSREAAESFFNKHAIRPSQMRG